MSRDLRDLLRDTTHASVGLPTTEQTWVAGRFRRRVRRVVAGAGSVVALVAVVVIGATFLPDHQPGLQVSGQPPGASTSPAPSEPTASEGGSSDAHPLAVCAESSGISTDDAQAYVWLPCPDAATYAEEDPPARFFGIQKARLVTDPRASTGGVAQRVEVMLDVIFTGPTDAEQERGYSAIIDPSIDALAGVTFADGLVTIDLTEEGARAASIGTTARAVFQATVDAAVFGGFVDVEALRITVEGDCVAWSTYVDGTPSCLTYHRDGTTTPS